MSFFHFGCVSAFFVGFDFLAKQMACPKCSEEIDGII